MKFFSLFTKHVYVVLDDVFIAFSLLVIKYALVEDLVGDLLGAWLFVKRNANIIEDRGLQCLFCCYSESGVEL